MNTILKANNISKEYRLGAIGGATLKGELQRWWAEVNKKDNPNSKIGLIPIDYNKRFMALNNISFEIDRGEAVGIIGHNGAGKSTLLKLISRVTAPTLGELYINGTIASMLEVGTGFHPELTGRENIFLNGAILGMTKNDIKKDFDRIVEFSEISQFIDTPVKRYSSGMYVKLAFSVAAHLNSDIMIMDEVLAVGDVDFQKKCLGRMSNAASNENRTVLYVSHNISTVRALCTKCMVLDHGEISFFGDVETAISKYLGLFSEKNTIDFDLSKKARRIDTKLSSGVKMLHAHIEGKDSNLFTSSESMIITIDVNSKKKYNNIIFGIINHYIDGRITGGVTTEKEISLDIGKNLIQIEFSTMNIPDGMYSLELTIDRKNSDGFNERLDSAKSAISYNIVNLENTRGYNWQHNVYGHTMYDTPTIRTI